MRWMVMGLALGLWADVAAAQQVNDAQQMAYARAYQGRWVNKANSTEMEVKNDGKEVRFALATVPQLLGNAGYKVNDVVYQGSFAGADFKGSTLMAVGSDPNARAGVRQRCGNADRFWVPATGKMNFERDQISMSQPGFALFHNYQTNKCEVIVRSDKRYAEVTTKYPGSVIVTNNPVTLVLAKKPGPAR